MHIKINGTKTPKLLVSLNEELTIEVLVDKDIYYLARNPLDLFGFARAESEEKACEALLAQATEELVGYYENYLGPETLRYMKAMKGRNMRFREFVAAIKSNVKYTERLVENKAKPKSDPVQNSNFSFD